MEPAKLARLNAAAENFTLPPYEEIPDVGLFLEQVVRYIAKYAEVSELAPLTGSMVSNYVKKKIITNPVKKMYARDQIAYLLFIMVAKNVIQIEDMQFLFVLQQQEGSVKTAYEVFRRDMKENLFSVFGLTEVTDEEAAGSTGEPELGEDRTAILQKICAAASHKIYLDRCLLVLKEQADG